MAMARILIVDDELYVLKMLTTCPAHEDYDIVATTRGDNAAEMIRSDKAFDLLVSDIYMRPVSGLDLLKLAREVRPSMPVMMMTAFHDTDIIDEIFKIGGFAFLQKPFDADAFCNKIRLSLTSREAKKPD